MHVRTILVAALIVAVTGVSSRGVQAQASEPSATDNAKLARIQLELAETAFNQKRYRDAVAAYLAADRLQPNPGLQLALAQSYEQLGDVSRALASYREYFNRSPRSPERAHVQGRVAALAQQLAEKGVQQVSVSSEPPGATVHVDTKPIGITPIYVDLPPGPHRLEFHQKGYQSAALDFELSPQQPLNVMTTLVPLPAGVAAAAPTAPAAAETAPVAAPQATVETVPAAVAEATSAPADATRDAVDKPTDATTTLMRTIGFAAIGTSVAALGGAVVLELMRSHSESRARQQNQQIAFARTLDTMRSQQTAARVFAVTAGVLAAAGGVLLVLAIDGADTEAPAEGLSLACVPSGCEVAFEGKF